MFDRWLGRVRVSMEIERYEFGGHEIQVFMIDGKPWWLANEVCKVLGYSNPRDAVKTACDQ